MNLIIGLGREVLAVARMRGMQLELLAEKINLRAIISSISIGGYKRWVQWFLSMTKGRLSNVGFAVHV
jgi:hypothetical protein